MALLSDLQYAEIEAIIDMTMKTQEDDIGWKINTSIRQAGKRARS